MNKILNLEESSHSLNLPSKHVIIDTDSGIDDIISIAVALRHEKTKLRAITVVEGNTSIKQGLLNLCSLLDINILSNNKVPIYPGCDKPIIQEFNRERSYTSSSSFHTFQSYSLPERNRIEHHVEKEHAVMALLRMVNKEPNELIIICLGPLTNIALAIRLDPFFLSKVKNIVVMGGCLYGKGNSTRVAEYAFNYDPEAAHIVFTASKQYAQENPHCTQPKLTVVPWEVAVEQGLDWNFYDYLIHTPPITKFTNIIKELSSIKELLFRNSHETILSLSSTRGLGGGINGGISSGSGFGGGSLGLGQMSGNISSSGMNGGSNSFGCGNIGNISSDHQYCCGNSGCIGIGNNNNNNGNNGYGYGYYLHDNVDDGGGGGNGIVNGNGHGGGYINKIGRYGIHGDEDNDYSRYKMNNRNENGIALTTLNTNSNNVDINKNNSHDNNNNDDKNNNNGKNNSNNENNNNIANAQNNNNDNININTNTNTNNDDNNNNSSNIANKNLIINNNNNNNNNNSSSSISKNNYYNNNNNNYQNMNGFVMSGPQTSNTVLEYQINATKFIMCDLYTLVCAIEPESVIHEYQDLDVEIELHGKYSRGMTCFDWLGSSQNSLNARVVIRVNKDSIKSILVNSFKQEEKPKHLHHHLKPSPSQPQPPLLYTTPTHNNNNNKTYNSNINSMPSSIPTTSLTTTTTTTTLTSLTTLNNKPTTTSTATASLLTSTSIPPPTLPTLPILPPTLPNLPTLPITPTPITSSPSASSLSSSSLPKQPITLTKTKTKTKTKIKTKTKNKTSTTSATLTNPPQKTETTDTETPSSSPTKTDTNEVATTTETPSSSSSAKITTTAEETPISSSLKLSKTSSSSSSENCSHLPSSKQSVLVKSKL